jgi:hypothetical protein
MMFGSGAPFHSLPVEKFICLRTMVLLLLLLHAQVQLQSGRC